MPPQEQSQAWLGQNQAKPGMAFLEDRGDGGSIEVCSAPLMRRTCGVLTLAHQLR